MASASPGHRVVHTTYFFYSVCQQRLSEETDAYAIHVVLRERRWMQMLWRWRRCGGVSSAAVAAILVELVGTYTHESTFH
jgi:hypothetical protein